MVILSKTRNKTVHQVKSTKDGRIPEIEKEISLLHGMNGFNGTIEITIKQKKK